MVKRLSGRDYLPFPAKMYAITTMTAVKYNVSSERIWHIVRQALAYMWTNGDLEQISDGNTAAIQLNSVNGDSSPTIGYINADTGIAKNHKELEEDITLSIIDMMAEAGVVVTRAESTVPESGVARGYRYRGQNSKLNNTVNMCRVLDIWMESTYKQYNDPSGTWTTQTVYKTDYAIKEALTVEALIEVLDSVRGAKLVESAKAIISELLAKAVSDPDVFKGLKTEVEGYILENNGTPELSE